MLLNQHSAVNARYVVAGKGFFEHCGRFGIGDGVVVGGHQYAVVVDDKVVGVCRRQSHAFAVVHCG